METITLASLAIIAVVIIIVIFIVTRSKGDIDIKMNIGKGELSIKKKNT